MKNRVVYVYIINNKFFSFFFLIDNNWLDFLVFLF